MKKILLLAFILAANIISASETNKDPFIEDSNCIAIKKCSYCNQSSESLKICSRCKATRYCGPDCQRADWPKHKQVCCTNVVKFNDFWLSDTPYSSDTAEFLDHLKSIRPTMPIDTSNINFDNIKSVVNNYLSDQNHEKKLLIVGCGKTPYSWKEFSSSNSVNIWRSNEDGIHTHEEALTLAESDSVNPDLLMDFLVTPPVFMHEKFDEIYFEKLPPGLLAIEQVYKNAYSILKPGGLLVFDFQARALLDKTNSIPKTILISPFEIVRRTDTIENTLEARNNLLIKRLQELGYVSVEIKIVENNPYNHRTSQSQVFAKKPTQ